MILWNAKTYLLIKTLIRVDDFDVRLGRRSGDYFSGYMSRSHEYSAINHGILRERQNGIYKFQYSLHLSEQLTVE